MITARKPSLQKIYKYFSLEAERGFDNHAILGGLERMLIHWETEARNDGIPEDLIQMVRSRVREYGHSSEETRKEMIVDMWQRIDPENEMPLPISSPVNVQSSETIEFTQEKTEIQESHSEVPAPQNHPNATVRSDTFRQDIVNQEISEHEFIQTKAGEISEQLGLSASVSVIQGVGPRHAQTLAQLGIITLRDLLYYFPRRYDDYSKLKPINRLEYGDELTVIGTIQNTQVRSYGKGNSQLFEIVLSDGSGSLKVSWFNQPWLSKHLRKGTQIVLAGKIDQYLGRMVMNNPEWEPLDQEHLNTNRIVPVYPLTARITQRWLRRLMNQVVTYWSPKVQDPLPISLINAAKLQDLSEALIQIHFPNSWQELTRARNRLAFDEIFLLQLGVMQQKRLWQEQPAQKFSTPSDWLSPWNSRLPFSLTGAQQRAFEEIRRDLTSGHPMNRLLQGDVGSGKTIIAAMAISAVTQSDGQAALMAPTSILAEQHYRTIQDILVSSQPDGLESNGNLRNDQVRLLIGDISESEKNEIRQQLINGEIKVLVGTHALIEDPVEFKNLQLVIVDEQHRFGVTQRAALRQKGHNPHLIVMTATPIPRSLALTIYGDLDLSIIDEMPAGRQEIDTILLKPYERERVYSLIQKQVEAGRQVFIVYPLVEESEKFSSKAAVEEHYRLQKEIFPNIRIGLLHGRMKASEKDAIMMDFRNENFQILVTTSVIEVGVDVPNATVMLVEGANRFGLAQLHQFRGRIGRGAAKSYCILIPDSEDAIENERLLAMTETNDGFILAERDLQQRGPGHFLGTRQSGYSDLRLASITDMHLIADARRHAHTIFENDPDLTLPENKPLAAALEQAWQETKGDIS